LITPDPHGNWYKYINEKYGATTTYLDNVNLTNVKYGIYIDSGAVTDVAITNSCVQWTDSSALVCEAGGLINLKIDNFYTEGIPKTKSHVYQGHTDYYCDSVACFKLGTKDDGMWYGRGNYEFNNLHLGANPISNKVIAFDVNWANNLNVSNSFLSYFTYTMITDTGTNAVNWEKNYEYSTNGTPLVKILQNDYTASNYFIKDSSRISVKSSCYNIATYYPYIGKYRGGYSPMYTNNPKQSLKNPYIVLGASSGADVAGKIKYAAGSFLGYDGTNWLELGNPPFGRVTKGTATISSGTSVIVTHGYGTTPDTSVISVTPLGNLSGASYWVSDIGITTFKINTSATSTCKFAYQLLPPEISGSDLLAGYEFTNGWTANGATITSSNSFSVGSGSGDYIKKSNLGFIKGFTYRVDLNYTLTGTDKEVVIYDDNAIGEYAELSATGTNNATFYFTVPDVYKGFRICLVYGSSSATLTINSMTVKKVIR
jgi:hypothetical protein